MRDSPRQSRSILERLPLELLQIILSNLESLSSLKSAVLTCHTLWRAGNSGQAVKNILFTKLDAEGVRYQAIATWQIRQLPVSAPRLEYFQHLDHLLKSNHRNAPPLSLTIRDAESIIIFNDVVEHLAEDFIFEALKHIRCSFGNQDDSSDDSNGANIDLHPSEWRPTSGELSRVNRGF